MSGEHPPLGNLQFLDRNFFNEKVDLVAQSLIGTFLIVDHGIGYPAGGRIIETEAYDQCDPAAHCYCCDGYNPQEKSKPMFLSGGHAYVYASGDGLCCLNFVCDKEEYGSAVLIRAMEPVYGIPAMRIRRVPYASEAATDNSCLCSSPRDLCEALGITVKYHNRLPLFDGDAYKSPFLLYRRVTAPQIACGPRVGVKETIKKNRSNLMGSEKAKSAIDRFWRFADAGCLQFVSRRQLPNDRKLYPLSVDRCQFAQA